MAKTIDEIVYSILERLSGFNLTDDFRISPLQIEKLAGSVRETLIREEFKAGMLSSDYYQRYDCVKLTKGERSCKHLETSVVQYEGHSGSIPSLISGVGNANLILVQIGQNAYSPLPPQVFFSNYNFGYGRKIRTYTIIDEIMFAKGMEECSGENIYAAIIALFSDPLSVMTCGVNRNKMKYPVPSDYKLEILMMKDILSTFNISPDVLNNTRDDTVGQKESAENVQ